MGQVVRRMTFLQGGKGGKAEVMAEAQELLVESGMGKWKQCAGREC